MTFSSLPYPVNFVVKYTQKWADLFCSPESSIPDPNALCTRIRTNEDSWIVLTYLHLKRRNLNVFISDRFVPGEICVVSSPDLGIRDLTFNSFMVGCRGDGSKPALCNMAIVQNRANVESATDIFIPLWPQPGLIPRLKERGNTIENIVFNGYEINLYAPFCSSEFQQELENLGVKLIINGSPESGPVMWHDYSTNDLVLAVRDLTEKDALGKPASKLVNAWSAGVPALLGPEPAFRDLRQSELDYIEVKTPKAVLEAIQRLKAQPETYQKMVLNGFRRVQEFSVDNIIKQWCQALAEPIAENYKRWKQSSQIIHAAEFVPRIFKHKVASRQAAYNRFHGYRIVSGQYT
ncbi:glycosyltransferase family 1 protein [Thermoleptolyngbya oregonensis NK1-22]|uniref:Glycosyltransferase family 1 protein n=1 Tax=Thermoleptolyngbya oregonensis NK1-22 TaxID=2547457 RepID=A0AA97BNA5_9CYAN|nr:glycosyltransferase [Thermoleptolyngbya oregonensis]WOB45207.1 glycosyltransferase family 1 protein [Thermoleptolyngbya oregonensis NK1-22]